MAISLIEITRFAVLNAIKSVSSQEWKILVIDTKTREALDSIVSDDDLLSGNITHIEELESDRARKQDSDAIYLCSPTSQTLDYLEWDIRVGRYRTRSLLWTDRLPVDLQSRYVAIPSIDIWFSSVSVLNIAAIPSESNLATFQDVDSFQILYNPSCHQLLASYLTNLAEKIATFCNSLNEYPIIRYWQPLEASHEAKVLCKHLARFTQEALDRTIHQSRNSRMVDSRQRGVLLITDRSLDMFAALVHEFTYQAMAHELLPLSTRGNRTFFASQAATTESLSEISQSDRIWLDMRHMHMKDLLEKLVADFNRFRSENPQFAESSENPNTLNNIKDMIAGLPSFQQGKDLYSLHLTMAQECMNVFQQSNLSEIASVEQTMATGLDEDLAKPRNVADQLVRLLDDESVSDENRLRLILQYVLFRGGLFPADIEKLFAHAELDSTLMTVVHSMSSLGANVDRNIRGDRNRKHSTAGIRLTVNEDSSLTRFRPVLQTVLEDLCKDALDEHLFARTQALPEESQELRSQKQTSLRSAKPTWAKGKSVGSETRARVIVFMAGGATYSEVRAIYDCGHKAGRDIYLLTSHLLTPHAYVQQLLDLTKPRDSLKLERDQREIRAKIPMTDASTKLPVNLISPSPSKSSAPAPAKMQGVQSREAVDDPVLRTKKDGKDKKFAFLRSARTK